MVWLRGLFRSPPPLTSHRPPALIYRHEVIWVCARRTGADMTAAPHGNGDPIRHWTETDWEPFIRDRVVNRLRMRYLDYGAGPALVLLHGMGASWQWWLENIPALATRHRVIAIDLPGFGHSEPLAAPAAMSTHADMVVDLLDQLNIRTATIAGHSMGGLIAIQIASTNRQLTQRLVLVDAGGVPMTERHLRMVLVMLRVFAAVLRRRFIRNMLATKPLVRQYALRAAFRDPAVLSPQLAAQIMPLLSAPGFVDAVAAAGRAVRETVPEAIMCPVLLVWGEDDPLAPLHCAEDMQAHLADSTLVAFSACGHTPQIEEPDGFNRAVLEFTAAQ